MMRARSPDPVAVWAAEYWAGELGSPVAVVMWRLRGEG
jgi:hypothetical protein